MSIFYGKNLKLEIYGASHAEAIGMRLWGFPAGEYVDIKELQDFLDRRRPGHGGLVSKRNEEDKPEFLSGLKDGKTSGIICAEIKNCDVRRRDYVNYIPRPSHADFTAWTKYGLSHDMSGGGEFSGRMTAPLCIAGGICLQYLSRRGIKISAEIKSIGGRSEGFEEIIKAAQNDGDSVGGIIECTAIGVPSGLGAELFGALESSISELAFAVPGLKGIEFGAGFAAAEMRGSEHNDEFILQNSKIVTKTNNSGGILGGISSGMPIVFRAALKPTPSIAKKQRSVDMTSMRETELEIRGRHDPCIALRAVPVIEAVCAIALADELIGSEKPSDLAAYRSRIDLIDSELCELIIKRLKLCEELGEYKKALGMPVYDPKREAEMLEAISGEYSEEIRALCAELFKISKKLQEEEQ